MEKIHNYEESNEVGQIGEVQIVQYIEQRPNVKKVVRVNNEEEYQKLDIDCLVTLFNKDTTFDKDMVSVEIKTDTYISKNIFYETISCIEKNTLGCMEKCKADYLFYYFIKTGELYIINMPAYRIWFNSNKSKFNFKQRKITNKVCEDIRYTSEGYLIPKRILEKDFCGYKKVNVKFNE